MKLRSSETFWPLKSAMKYSYPSIDADLSTEILIIGGGITGALIAYKLISEGKKVILVDRRDVANGSTAASTALLQYEIDVSLHELIKIRGTECAVDSYTNGKKAIFDLRTIIDTIKSECQFEFKKSIYYCSLKKDIPFLKNEFKCRKEHGFDVNWLERWDLEKMGLNAIAAIESKTAAVMDPYKLANDLLHYCKKKGMQIFDRTNITSIQNQKSKLIAHTENKFTITAEHIIHCSGYESTETLTEKVVDLKSTFVIASENLEVLPTAFKNAIFWDTSSPYLYFRVTSDNRIIMGGSDEDFKDTKKRDKLLPKKEQYLLRHFKKKFPNINFKIDYSWAGTFGETKDGLPYFGKPDPSKNEHYVLGFGGNGITFSVIGMNSIMDSINNKKNQDLEYYRFGR
ncbi:Gamma-glutamylputrescine oxidoreductase [Flavobacterium bizetiae]|uniref:Gamma-glutamylputrescine oxidoreductase n=1 Tax=Flavobacterium bizetiae TaxID=2704140 RepID=A0A6J4GC24_9FLAO|nr:FAD-dependent oxidoreductase [Flavobacterium bizetiae]CAA9196776.1 Gamma-glutamylputrescine oxidoreductase [Flavobacterium bizetiae]CAD5342424.1 Gamma-glutamylputrescine oxidoreductase [Flavobacterium bizetiae]CAD5348340.1 Gamma-glutamylputrescine oxidoreductase [Flavobacterium bizetiae]